MRVAAAESLRAAEAATSAAEGRRPEVEATVARLREMRRENHFAEMFRAALGGGGS